MVQLQVNLAHGSLPDATIVPKYRIAIAKNAWQGRAYDDLENGHKAD